MRLLRHKVFISKVVIFILLAVMMVDRINWVLLLKNGYHYPTSNQITDKEINFYHMVDHSVDVVFLGSSHAGAAFNPQDLYNLYHITGYNLSTNIQTVYESYYWLQEALEYQNLKAVVFDCYALWNLAQDEGSMRQTFDGMKNSGRKMEAVTIGCKDVEGQSKLSYLFTNIRYHDRWTALSEQDFIWRDMYKIPSKLKGFYIFADRCGYQDFVPLEIEGTSKIDFAESGRLYLDKILELCRETGTELILVKTPTLYETVERHNAIAEYAQDNHLQFYDFNEKELYEKIEFDYEKDMSDTSIAGNCNAHANPDGARKMTNFIGGVILETCDVEPHEDWQYEATRDFNEHFYNNFLLRTETDVEKYLSLLQEDLDSYTVFMAVKGDAAQVMSDTVQTEFSALGLTSDWGGASGMSYYAMIEGGQVMEEQMSDKKLSYKGAFRDGEVIYSITSAGANCGNDCSIQINFGEQAKRQRGLNIVVYDNEMHCIVDQVCFDTCGRETAAVR